MSIDVKELITMGAIGTVGLLLGIIFGFVGGVSAGDTTGYQTGYGQGVDAGISYTDCVIEETPLYSEVTQETIDYCWETFVYR